MGCLGPEYQPGIESAARPPKLGRIGLWLEDVGCGRMDSWPNTLAIRTNLAKVIGGYCHRRSEGHSRRQKIGGRKKWKGWRLKGWHSKSRAPDRKAAQRNCTQGRESSPAGVIYSFCFF